MVYSIKQKNKRKVLKLTGAVYIPTIHAGCYKMINIKRL